MNGANSTQTVLLGPITPDWTVERLLQWIAEDDARLDDPRLAALLRTIEAELTGITSPGLAAVSLVRSLVLHLAAHPALRARPVVAPSSPVRIAHFAASDV